MRHILAHFLTRLPWLNVNAPRRGSKNLGSFEFFRNSQFATAPTEQSANFVTHSHISLPGVAWLFVEGKSNSSTLERATARRLYGLGSCCYKLCFIMFFGANLLPFKNNFALWHLRSGALFPVVCWRMGHEARSQQGSKCQHVTLGWLRWDERWSC